MDCNADEKLIMSYKEEAEKHGLKIAEVGIWRYSLAADLAER